MELHFGVCGWGVVNGGDLCGSHSLKADLPILAAIAVSFHGRSNVPSRWSSMFFNGWYIAGIQFKDSPLPIMERLLVTSWKTDNGRELLFVSHKATFKPPKAIRGGIPICFPQVGSHGALKQHGFARNRFWSIDPNPPPLPTRRSFKAFVDLILRPSEEDSKIWPHSYEFRLRITLGPGGDLMLTSRIRNTNADGKPFSFTFAYHTYFSLSDISEVRVEGLETLYYLDNLKAKERFTEQADAITFESEVDKIYLDTPTKIAIIDHERKRTFVLRKEGLPDAVVWNPWDKKAKAMADFGDDEYKRMLCVEAAAVGRPIILKPGEEWTGKQELTVVPSSYYSGQLDPSKVLQS